MCLVIGKNGRAALERFARAEQASLAADENART
jgi:hypothetical protein